MSPRRRELLENVRIPLVVLPAEADERVLSADTPASYLERVTQAKLDAVTKKHAGVRVGVWLTADTIVLVDGEILGKPADVAEAERMVTRLVGASAPGPDALRDRRPAGELLHAETATADVWFRTLEADEIADYAASGEGLDKAGAYAVQGLGAFAIARIDGSTRT